MNRKFRLTGGFLILAACAVGDQAAKGVARQNLAGRPAIEMWGGILRLEYAENSGAFLSLGAGLPAEVRVWLLTVFVTVVLVGALIYIWRAVELNASQLVGLALIAGGGLGNLIDRVFHGGMVVDFAVLSIGPLHTGIFNVADVALMAGIGLFVIGSLAVHQAPEPEPQ